MEHILVTGGTGSLGIVVVNKMTDAGRCLHLASRQKPGVVDGNQYTYPVELTNQHQCLHFVESVSAKAGRISAGVFMAGGFMPGSLTVTSIDDINAMVELNFATAFNTAVYLLNHFRSAGGGKLIFVGSKAAHDHHTAACNVAYSLSKQMLSSFSTMINRSEKDAAIASCILLPGTLDTASNRKHMPYLDDADFTSCDEVAEAITDFISGKDARTVIEF